MAFRRTEHDRYRRQLDELRRLRDIDLPRLLRDARTFVASDAAEKIVQISVDQTVADARIAQLESLLQEAAVIEDEDRAVGVVALGRTVEVRHTRTGIVRSYRVGGIAGPDRARFVSIRSPVGQALLGRTAGDVVSVTLPTGAAEELVILSVADGGANRPSTQR
jgi:transcription elongation GreA/GreB family factor